MVFRLILTLSICAFIGTSSLGQIREIRTYKSFAKEADLKHSKIHIKEAVTPTTIQLWEDTVVLVDKNSDPAIHFYNLNNWSLIGSYGMRGDGPAEVRVPKFHGQFVQENNKTYLWFSDFRSTKLLKLGLKDMIEDIGTEPAISLKMPYEVGMLYDDIYAMSDTEFVGTVQGNVVDFTGENSGRFFISDVRKKSLNWIPNFPNQSLETPPEKVGYLYSSQTTWNEERKKLASGMSFFDRIDIIDPFKNSVLTVVQEDNKELKEVDLGDDHYLIPPNIRYFYGQGYNTNSYIYFLYQKTTGQQSMDFYDGKVSTLPNLELHVFDWNGNAILKGKLDRHNLGSFFVDEKTWNLYAIDHDPEKEDEVIVSYQLPNLSKN